MSYCPKGKGKGIFYIAQYPFYCTAQSALHFSSPGRPVHSDTNSASIGSILPMQQLRNEYSLTFIPLSIARYSFIQLSEQGRQWRERKCPIFETVAKGDSNPGSLDCESGILPLGAFYFAGLRICQVIYSSHSYRQPSFFGYANCVLPFFSVTLTVSFLFLGYANCVLPFSVTLTVSSRFSVTLTVSFRFSVTLTVSLSFSVTLTMPFIFSVTLTLSFRFSVTLTVSFRASACAYENARV